MCLALSTSKYYIHNMMVSGDGAGKKGHAARPNKTKLWHGVVLWSSNLKWVFRCTDIHTNYIMHQSQQMLHAEYMFVYKAKCHIAQQCKARDWIYMSAALNVIQSYLPLTKLRSGFTESFLTNILTNLVFYSGFYSCCYMKDSHTLTLYRL